MSHCWRRGKAASARRTLPTPSPLLAPAPSPMLVSIIPLWSIVCEDEAGETLFTSFCYLRGTCLHFNHAGSSRKPWQLLFCQLETIFIIFLYPAIS